MSTIKTILEPYAELEQSVGLLMKSFSSSLCGSCSACCCRADICEEAANSAFLSMLLDKQGLSRDDMDDRIGWRDLQGCSLEYGRPTVCYAFFCNDLLDRLPDDDARYAATVLGRLMDHVGKEALGGWHLTEIMNPADLEKIPVERLHERIEEAQAAVEVIDQYTQTGRLDAEDRQILLQIRGVDY